MSDALDQAIEYLRQNHSPAEVQEILLQKLKAMTSSAVAQPRSSATVRMPSATNTSTLKTSPFKTVTVVSAPLRPSKDLCLSNLYQIEQDHAPLSNGYSVIHVGSSYSDVGSCEIYRGDVQQQQYQCEENLVYLEEADGAPRRLFDDKEPFTMPSLEDISSDYAASELEQVMEDELAGCSDLQTSQDYLIAAAHTIESRKRLGLPESPLEAGTCLLSTLKHYPGIHSSYGYVSKNHTKFALHVEDFYLKSANLLHAGAAKLWVIINPQCTYKLEGRLANLLEIQPKCSQFLRHKMLLPSPSLLHLWRIQFSMVLQQPGDLILIDSNAYHYGVNLGPNIAEAINYSDPDWIVPPTYRDCAKNKGCGDTKHMTSVKMKTGSARALDIEDYQEIGLKTSYPNQDSHSQAPTSKQTNMVLRSRSSCAPVKPYPKSTPTSRHITTRSAQALKQNVKGKAGKDEKQKGRKDKDGEMEIHEGEEGEKDKKDKKGGAEKDKNIEVEKDQTDESSEARKDQIDENNKEGEGEGGESESEQNKNIEAEKDQKGEAEKNKKDEGEENMEVEKDGKDKEGEGDGGENKKTEAEQDEKGEAEENEKGESEENMEVEKDGKDKEGEGEKGESDSGENKKTEAEQDEKGEAEENEKGEGEENMEDEEGKSKNDENGEAKKNEKGAEKNQKSEVKTDQTGDADKDKGCEADAENAETVGVEKIDGTQKENLKIHDNEQEDASTPKSNGLEDAELNEANNSDVSLEEVERMFVGIQKQKRTESIESAELCVITNLTQTDNDDNGKEEDEDEDFDTDETPPAYEAGDSVGEIRWWIWFATHHHKESTWSSFPSTTQNTKQLRHDLSCFDPTQQPVRKTWLNDRVILHVLKSLFLFDDKTQVLDPIHLRNALEKRNTRFLHLDSDMTHLIVPYHRNDHWCLFIVNVSDGKVEVYDTTEETNPAVQFLETSLSTSFRWNVTHKPLFPGASDESNCGVFTIAHSEAFLSSGQLPSTCPTELRLRYIRRLVKPLYDELESARHLGQNQVKRKGSFPHISTAEHQTKRLKHLPFALSIPVAEKVYALNKDTIAEKISRFSAEWTRFYRDQVVSQHRTPEDMHLILALVSAVGCPQVMADLTDMLRDTQTPSPSNNQTQAALTLYTNAEKNLLRSKIWMRYASIYMYLAFEEIKKSVQSRQGSWKVARRKAARQDKRIIESGASSTAITPLTVTNKAASYALEQLTADALGVSVEELRQHERRNAYKEKIRKIKDEGKAAHSFNEICKQRLWILVPAQNMASPLDDSIVVKPNMYLQLSQDHMRLFAYALQELRPKLGYLISRAADLYSILRDPFQDRRMTYRLEVLGAEAILKEELDSHDLLHCLDEVPSSV